MKTKQQKKKKKIKSVFLLMQHQRGKNAKYMDLIMLMLYIHIYVCVCVCDWKNIIVYEFFEPRALEIGLFYESIFNIKQYWWSFLFFFALMHYGLVLKKC